MEARILLSGKQTVYGARINSLGGEVRESNQRLLVTTADAFASSYSSQDVFVVALTPGSLLVVLSGFMTIVATVESCIGIRWSVGGDDADSNRVAATLTTVLLQFLEMRRETPGLSKFEEFLASASGA